MNKITNIKEIESKIKKTIKFLRRVEFADFRPRKIKLEQNYKDFTFSIQSKKEELTIEFKKVKDMLVFDGVYMTSVSDENESLNVITYNNDIAAIFFLKNFPSLTLDEFHDYLAKYCQDEKNNKWILESIIIATNPWFLTTADKYFQFENGKIKLSQGINKLSDDYKTSPDRPEDRLQWRQREKP